jgi:uncharacterized membrane protein
MNGSKFFVLPLLFLFAFTLYSQGQGNMAVSDFQCLGRDTFAAGLNDAGQVVGWHGSFEEARGFVKQKKDGTCEELPVIAGSNATIALGINDPGQIVGITYPGSQGNGSAFLYEKGVYTVFDYPGAGSGVGQTCQTFAFSINNRGQIVGLYDLWKADAEKGKVCDGPDKPFLREADGTFVPLADSTWTDSAQANGINPRGMTIGNYIKASTCTPGPCHENGFLRRDGVVWPIVAADDAVDTMPTGINAQGQIVGRYFTEPWLEAVGPCHSFFLDSIDKVPVEIKYPNAAFTCIGSINAPGEVSGAWTNDWANGPWHGFVVDLKVLLPPTP